MNPTPTTNRFARLSTLAPRLLSFAFLVAFATAGWGQATLPVSATFSTVTTSGPGTMPTGFTQSGLGGYAGSLKFDTAGDSLSLAFDSSPGNLTFNLGVNNSFTSGTAIPATITFDVQQSSDGTNWTSASSYTNTTAGNKTITNLQPTTRYIKWVYTTKPSGSNIALNNITLSAGAVTPPTITGNATAAAFTTTYGTASANQSFSIGGSGLSANLVATAPIGFEVSADGTTYASTATFTQSGGSASGTLRARLAANATVSGSYNAQNIVLSSANATSVNIATAASGNTVSMATPSLSITSASSAVANGTVSLTSTSSAASVAVSASTGNITYTSSNNSVATISGATLTAVAAGTTTITASQASDANYNAANATQTFTVTSATSPAISPSTSTLTGFTTTSPDASAAQSLTVNAINLSPASGSLTVTGSTNYEVSTTSDSAGFGNTATLSYSGSAISAANVWIRLKASLAAGDYNSETIAISGGGATTQNIAVSGTVIAATPVISTNGTLTAFSTVSGNASAAQTLSVTGNNLTANITASAPTGFEVSTDGTSFASNATISQTSGSASATLSVRIASTASVGALTGNLVLSSTGASGVTIALGGNVTSGGGNSTTIAQWTFETSIPAGNGTTISGIAAEVGSGTASGVHASSSSAWSNPTGNGSPESFSANNWGVGDYFQFQTSTTGYSSISLQWDQTGSNTGPANFKVQYSTDNSSYTDASGGSYSVTAQNWNSTTSNSSSTRTISLAGVSALNNAANIYIRLVQTNTSSINAGTVATTGTGRVDNVTITGTASTGSTPEAPAITSATTASATVGIAFNYTITASNNATSYAATGLPAGLTVNSTSGLISGTPTTAGTTNATISATNTGGTGNATLAFTIAQGTPVITTPPTASEITAGQALSSSTLTGGNASVAGTFAFADPSFILSATASQTVVFTPTDAANYTTANTSVTVTVIAAPVSAFTSWTGGNLTMSADLLPLYAIGGGSYDATVASETPVLSTTGGNLTLTAIVRTDDPALSITGETVSALSDSWSTLGNGTATGVDQTGVTTGLERRTFTTPADGTKKFLRLRAIYTP